jgi:hypothetical protein
MFTSPGVSARAEAKAEAEIRIASAAARASVQRINYLQWPEFKAPVSD